MKNWNLQKLFLASVMVVSLIGFTPLLRGRPGLAQDQGSQHAQPPQQAPQQQQGAQTFKGTITKAGEKMVLKESAQVSYDLDDQEKAKSFEGKDVKVVGTLDASTNTIHVSDIQPAS